MTSLTGTKKQALCLWRKQLQHRLKHRFILSKEKASKLWLQICEWSRGGLSSVVSWSADSLHACWACDAEPWSSWVSDLEACTSCPKINWHALTIGVENNIQSIKMNSEGHNKAYKKFEVKKCLACGSSMFYFNRIKGFQSNWGLVASCILFRLI